MLEEDAVVVAVGPHHVEIETRRRSACGHCDAKGACGTSLVASLFPSRVARLRVPAFPGLRAGDRVVIGLDENGLQRASVLLYLVPMLGLLAGAILPNLAFVAESARGAELLSIIGGLTGLTAGLLAVAAISRRPRGVRDLQAMILRVQGGSVDLHDLVRSGGRGQTTPGGNLE